jgi:thiosulfate/3-mercaptopyruvate sulfurtransferase
MSRPLVRSAVLALGLGFASPAAAQNSADLLVTPHWLQQHAGDPGLVILHVGARATYDTEHIAGARFIQVSDIATSEPPGIEMLPDDSLQHQLQRFGISDGSQVVVVFSDQYVSPAARVIFTLYYAGLGDRASLLDGGLAEWKRAGLPVTSAVPPATPGRVTLHVNPGLIVDHAYMLDHGATAHVRLVDARTPNYYAGADIKDQAGTHPVGHIAGARNIAFNTVFDDANQLLPRSKLVELFAAAGIAPGDTVVAYCHAGQQASALLLAARRAGFPTRLYDGSMNDWLARKLPIVNVP